MGSERTVAKLPEGMVSLVLTSQKACNNEPLGISKKEKHKLQEAKCSSFGHVSWCRMCAGTSLTLILHHWKGKVDLMYPLVQPVLYFLHWNLRNLADSLACRLAGGAAETSRCWRFPSGLGVIIPVGTPLSARLSAVPNSDSLKEEGGWYHVIELLRNRFDLLDWT